MKIGQFLLDYIDPSPAKKRDEQAKQFIIGIRNVFNWIQNTKFSLNTISLNHFNMN
jgi:hypothetical protein